ncbi:type I polyketide synthase [Streptomyces lycii]|uniref:Acyltransferase domain-containing protein n=1 Tax=Streptomyces lycii TaxID=2654337 RepID=A0ABQ7FK91_9ACTN|nr:type I polyketide synthase [Streptomyces lycii]KAF4408201.1 acyltransferase domain-containing protein [Streptomyces lycii]
MARDRSFDIAVTGMSGRFPGAADTEEWWTALTEGRVLTRRYDRDELIGAGVPRSLVDDPDYVPVHGHLDDADRFDNTVFRVSPREAELMDPQHRLMLEVAWSALEDAGAGPLEERVSTGVYASASGSGYLRSMVRSGALDPLTLEDAVHGTEPDFMASLISYKLGLTGPALAVQTACSSSLVAVHLACQALLNGDCDQALVVAAGIPFPQAGQLHVPGGIHSPSGRCRPFDESADGVVAGSGVACVVLRRLADALEDGPDPYGVLLGTAVNNDGAAKAGYYAPSVTGQEAVIRAALLAADVDAASIGYLETHGTGTRVGDPLEWSAASAALAGAGAAPGQVAVGALKANTGHLDNAAGVASLIKALLVVKEGVVPPVAGFTGTNPLLETEGSPLYVPREAAPWTGPEPRRAGVSSFGIGGTNAHVIVEQPPPAPAAPDRAPDAERLVLLSAATPEALSRSAARLAGRLAAREPDLADVAFTLGTARAALPERLAVAGRTTADVARRLGTWGAGEARDAGDAVVTGSSPVGGPAPVVFAFPGQGAQRPGMAAPLAGALPGFAAALDGCLAAFGSGPAERLRRALLDPEFPADELAETELAQPALFAVEYAAATALSGLGVTPVALVGHSLGEITAACVAGALDPADAARLVTVRGQAMQRCPEGAMLAVGCDADRTRALLAEFGPDSGAGPGAGSGELLELAAVNSPDGCVVAGTAEAVEEFRVRLGDRVFTHRLATRRAFHTALIEPALPALSEAAAALPVRSPRLPFATNTTGGIVEAGAEFTPSDFVAQARGTVRFAEALEALGKRFPGALVVEAGPGRALTAMADASGLDAVPLCPGRTGRPAEEVLTALGTLWTRGQPVAAAALAGPGRCLHLPGHVFAGPRWMAPEAAPAGPGDPEPAHPARPGGDGAPAAAGPAAERTPESVPESAAETVTDSADESEAAEIDAAELMSGLWTQLLGHEALGDDSDFFQLGGDSLLITHLARKVRTRTGTRVPVRDLLAARTLGRQTEIVRGLLTPESRPREPVAG